MELEKGIKGLVVMSSSLEETFNCMYDGRVPPLWEKVPDTHAHTRSGPAVCRLDMSIPVHQAYPSLKPLAAWTRDLCQRVGQFARWAETGQPPILFWLSGFTFPNGFLTAVLQSYARQHNVRHTAARTQTVGSFFTASSRLFKQTRPAEQSTPCLTVSSCRYQLTRCPGSSSCPPWTTATFWTAPRSLPLAVFLPLSTHPLIISPLISFHFCLLSFQDGVFVRGLYLEGAGWDRRNSCLVEAEPMQMVCPIPTIHFKPVENRKKTSKSECQTFCQVLSTSCVMSRPVMLTVCVCRHVRVSVLLLPCAFGRSGPTIVCAQCGTEVWSCAPGSLDQERDRSPHEPGQLNGHGLVSVLMKPCLSHNTSVPHRLSVCLSVLVCCC